MIIDDISRSEGPLGREKDLVYAGIAERQEFFVATQRQVQTFSEACMSYLTPIAQILII